MKPIASGSSPSSSTDEPRHGHPRYDSLEVLDQLLPPGNEGTLLVVP